MQKYKAIISDIDGTITTKQTRQNEYPLPSKNLISVITEIVHKVDFVLATSRSLVYTEYLFDVLKLSSPSIVQSGTLIVDPKTREVLWEKQIRKQDLFTIVNYFLEKRFSFIIDEKEKTAIKYTKDYIPNDPLNIFVSELTDEQAKEIEQELAEVSTISLHRVTSWTSSKWGFNITSSEAGKQQAVLQVAKLLNISTEGIIGIGDGWNDFSLLMACGLKIAMGNAVYELKEIADYVAPSIEEDGVATVINKFILNKTL